MSEGSDELIVAAVRVYDDLADQTFVVNLENVVQVIDDPNERGKHHSLIVTLINAEILDRHPHVMANRNQPLDLTIEEFSDLKIEVIQKLLAWVKPSLGPVV